MNWGDIALVFLQFALGIALAACTAAMPYILPIIRARLEKATDKDTADKFMAAADAAAGAAYKYAATHKGGFRDPVVSQNATQVGVDYLHQEMAETIEYYNKSPTAVRQMVNGRIGRLMAADPTISAAVGSAVPTTNSPSDATASAPLPMPGSIVSLVDPSSPNPSRSS